MSINKEAMKEYFTSRIFLIVMENKNTPACVSPNANIKCIAGFSLIVCLNCSTNRLEYLILLNSAPLKTVTHTPE